MSAQAKSSGSIHEGDRVSARVVRLVSSGAIVQLDEGEQGIIRNRELSWQRLLNRSDHIVSVGDEFDLIVLRLSREEGLMELSLRQALGDPWKKVLEGKYRPGKVVSGEVVDLQSFGAFVEIEPGIVGLLHKSGIPGGEDAEIQTLLWLGDQIEALIVDIDPQERQVGLSIVELLNKRRDDHRSSPGTGGARRRLSHGTRREPPKLRYPAKQVLGEKIRQILVVDDDMKFADGFAEWLRRLGYEVTLFENGGQVQLDDPKFNLAFLDLDLPDTNGMILAESLLDRNPDIDIVLMTGLTWLERDTSIPDDLLVVDVLLKPLDYEEVLRILSSLEEGTSARVSPRDSDVFQRDVEFLDRISRPLASSENVYEALRAAIGELREETGAAVVMLFQVDPLTHRISLAGASGLSIASVAQDELQTLRLSVVKDVAIGEEEIIEGSAASFPKRFETLLAFRYFQSCIAVPIPIARRDSRYALFLLDPRPYHFKSAHLLRALTAARVLGGAMREEYMRSLVEESQRSILTGQLASSLLHELRNKINRVEQQARLMELDCQDMAETPGHMPLPIWLNRLEKRVERILQTNDELRDLTHEYLGFMREMERQIIDVNELLLKTIAHVASIARENGVDAIPKLDKRLPPTRMVPLQLEQAFLNLALNAIQQMGLNSPRGGVLEVATLYDLRSGDRPIKVRFMDEGPGIHHKQWDWIFEMGTSTRRDGAGLGLFVSKRLLASMGGRISVEKSHMFVGSTFLIELPVLSLEETTNG